LYTVQTKELAARNVFASAATATNTVLTQNVASSDPIAALPQPCSITRAANRHRTKNRPRHPKTLDFQLLTEHVPDGFLRQDLAKSTSRHLLLATEEQLQLLSKTKTW